MMSIILGYPLGYMEDAEKCERVCNGIGEKHGIEDFLRARIEFVVYGLRCPWRVPFPEVLGGLQSAASVGLLSGDIDSVSFVYIYIYKIVFCFVFAWSGPI